MALLIMILAFFGYIAMYHLYGKYIGRRIFRLDDSRKTPSVEFEDGIDFVPTKKEIIFGHHFTSIAGTGPIVGPAIAIIWGWLPAMLWVFLGSIIMGAVHDFGSLVISLRNQGKSISEYTAKYINSRTKLFFFVIVFLELWILVSIFGLVIAVIFNMYPSAVVPVWLEIPIAMYLGYLVYKKGAGITLWSIVAVVVMYATVVMGHWLPVRLPEIAGLTPVASWSLILLIYAFLASVLPVTTLLQPRDFINAYQLLVAMALMVLGVIFTSFGGTHLRIVAPMLQTHPEGAPSLVPFLFITIACGAISGWHSLVSSGTSSKQVRKESDSLFVGYGSMLTEGALATLVILSVAAGIGLGYTTRSGETLVGVSAWTTHYASWAAAKGLASKVAAFVVGAANMIQAIGIPRGIAITIMGVFVAAFAGTTMDSAMRIQRYVLTELFPVRLKNRYLSTSIVALLAVLLIFSTGADGKGALILWPLFGAVNQTLAALALIIVTVYLKAKGGLKWLLSGIPAVFMLVMSFWATVINQLHFIRSNPLLTGMNLLIILAVIWVTVEGAVQFVRTTPETRVKRHLKAGVAEAKS